MTKRPIPILPVADDAVNAVKPNGYAGNQPLPCVMLPDGKMRVAFCVNKTALRALGTGRYCLTLVIDDDGLSLAATPVDLVRDN